MSDNGIIEANTALTFIIKWDCRRCGHTGGVAKTKIPIVYQDANEATMRGLFDMLRKHLVKKHQMPPPQGQGCIASPDDFIIKRATREDALMAGLGEIKGLV